MLDYDNLMMYNDELLIGMKICPLKMRLKNSVR